MLWIESWWLFSELILYCLLITQSMEISIEHLWANWIMLLLVHSAVEIVIYSSLNRVFDINTLMTLLLILMQELALVAKILFKSKTFLNHICSSTSIIFFRALKFMSLTQSLIRKIFDFFWLSNWFKIEIFSIALACSKFL